MNRFYSGIRYLNINTQKQLETSPYKYYLYFLVLGIFVPASEILIEAYQIRPHSDLDKALIISIFCFFILIFSSLNKAFRQKLYLFFCFIFMAVSVLILLDIADHPTDKVTILDFTIISFFSYQALYSRRIYFIYNIGLGIFFLAMISTNHISADFGVFYINIVLIGFMLNYAIGRIDRNVYENLLLTNEILNNSDTVVIGLRKFDEKVVFVTKNIDSILEINAATIQNTEWKEITSNILNFEKNGSGQTIQKLPKDKIIEWSEKSLNDEILLKIGHDITERYYAESVLKINEEKFRFISENVSDIIVVTNGIEILYISPSFEKVTGYSIAEAKQLLKKDIYHFMTEDFKNSVQKNVENAFQKKLPFCVHEYKFQHKDGTYFWREDTVDIIYNDLYKRPNAIILSRDISERKKTELLEAERQKRITEQNNLLFRLSKIPLENNSQFGEIIKNITRAISEGLNVERVSYWDFLPDSIQLIDLYSSKINDHESGKICEKIDFPAYFEAIESGLAIVANDARVHPSTNEFTDKYLIPSNIYSMLDVPVRVGERLVGVVCIEHTEFVREWNQEDINFAIKIADIISIRLEAEKRKIAEEKSVISEQNFKQISETIEDVFWLYDFVNKKYIYISPSTQKVLGAEASYFYDGNNKYYHDFAKNENKNLLDSIIEQFRIQNSVEVEYQIEHPKNGVRWINEKIYSIRNEKNDIIRLSGICTDITDKKNQQIQIKQLSLVAEKIKNGVVIADAAGFVIWANQAYLDMMEIDFNQLFRKRPRDLFGPLNDEITDFIATANGENFSIELEIETFQKNKKWIEVNNTAIIDENNTLTHQIEVVIDITNRKSAEIKILQAQEEANIANKQKAELELKALQMQMNPHFVFNALNSIQSYILSKEALTANNYLTKFAHLMRMFLDSSRSKFISVENEIKLLSLYIELEKLRFEDKFEFKINIENNQILHLEIPTMILQPFVENAINHGLRYKDQKGNLIVSFSQDDNYIQCQITDDGVGFIRSKEIQKNTRKGYESQGLKITTERIKIYNRLNHANIEFEISNNHKNIEDTGTKVIMRFPKV